MLDGFDSRCWTSQGLVAPDPLPVVWQPSEGLSGYPDDDPIPLWEDVSGLKNNMLQTDSAIAPVKKNDGTWDYAEFTQHSRLDLKNVVELCDAFQLFIVANIPPMFAATFLSCGLTMPALTIEPTRWIYNRPLNSVVFSIGGGASGLMLICLGRKGNQMKASKGGAVIHTQGQQSQLHLFLTLFQAVALYRRVIPPIFNVIGPVGVYEVMAFDTWLTDGQFAGWVTYLAGKFGL